MTTKKFITAVILSAGKSSRMKGLFKPLLPLAGVPIIEKAVGVFHNAGIRDIRCVTGYRSDDLADILKKNGVRELENKTHEKGMFSSVVTAVSSLEDRCDAFFILPVDIPLVRETTVRTLLNRRRSGSPAILYPVFKGMRGHPPLIPAIYAQQILQWQGGGGLKGFLGQYNADAVDVPVADEWMLRDVDTRADYQHFTDRLNGYDIPTRDECHVLMTDIFKVDAPIVRHCRKVAQMARSMGDALNRRGENLDLDLITAAGLVHDIARMQKHHAAVGAAILKGMGFERVADIVSKHMDIGRAVAPEGSSSERPSEAEVVFMADKMVQGETVVSMEKRYMEKIRRHHHDPEAVAVIKRRFADALVVKEKIDRVLFRGNDDDLSDAAR